MNEVTQKDLRALLEGLNGMGFGVTELKTAGSTIVLTLEKAAAPPREAEENSGNSTSPSGSH